VVSIQETSVPRIPEVAPERKRERYSVRKAVEVIKDNVPIEQVASEYGEFRLLGKGRLLGRCVSPLHEDKTPSMTVFTDTQRFKCFGCGIGGDVLDLEEFAGRHAELWTAVVALSTRYEVELPGRPRRWHKWQSEKTQIRDAAENARKVVRRKRLFKVLVLTGPEFEIEDENERREAVAEAWEIFSSGMRRIGQ
jgi:CHC2 zinc finger